MNINDIMRRDIADAERKAEADAYEREIKRRLRRRRLRAFGEVAGVVAFCALLAAFGWLCCVGSGYNWE